MARPPGRLTVPISLPGRTPVRHGPRRAEEPHRPSPSIGWRHGPAARVASPSRKQPEALSIAALYRQVQAAVTAAFPRGHLQWVRGEIQSISDRTGHCYMDLVDPDARPGPRHARY